MSDEVWRKLEAFGIRRAEPPIYDEPTTIAHIFQTIVQNAFKDGATEIVMEPQTLPLEPEDATLEQNVLYRSVFGSHRIRVQVLYRIENQWHEQLTVPIELLPPLLDHLRSLRAQSTLDGPFSVRFDEKVGTVRATIVATALGDKITLYLN